MSTLRASATTTAEQVREVQVLQDRLARAFFFVRNNLLEVKNDIGGAIGYRLDLTPDETETLWRILEGKK